MIGNKLYWRIIKEMDDQKIDKKELSKRMNKSVQSVRITLNRLKEKNQISLRYIEQISNALGKDIQINFIDPPIESIKE